MIITNIYMIPMYVFNISKLAQSIRGKTGLLSGSHDQIYRALASDMLELCALHFIIIITINVGIFAQHIFSRISRRP